MGLHPAGSTDTGVEEHRPDTSCNVVIFGEAGAGKSSLINLIARTTMAQTSHDARGCTTETNGYDIMIQDNTLKVKLFDTAGLDEGPRGAVPDEEARRLVKNLLRTLMDQGGIHLVMYCVRGERAISALRRNYEFIHSQVTKQVPIVLVVTGLENYEPDMEEWWRVNERSLGMSFAGHACVTTAPDKNPGSHLAERRNQSYDAICSLIKQSMTKRKKVVLFGQTGAGKSSLINLMAGKDVAVTSNDAKRHTMHSAEYDIEFGGDSYKVFDTIGLEEPQPGLSQYLKTVKNVYKLIRNLERQGGIDLFLFCMPGGRLTATVENNYRLFHEFLCKKKAPVVVAITHLEEEEGAMEAWWERHKETFLTQDDGAAGHACIITADRHGKYPDLYEESRVTIHKLVKECSANGQNQARVGENKGRKLKELFARTLHARTDIIIRLMSYGMSRDVAARLVDIIDAKELLGSRCICTS
ncbi:P-loop containing nucleoside triphosphate hydrolase protein [Suillus paluster]|uniref:P-loop containing nucleoside triphosphate hydrolase protein n=1 Tax=Suillus paluster TaxID=48578 RepID=UPI001B87E18B|nr:P-loop containing nucleoside triphosphate hydrolase protein [Suillus paluster]KAG1741417.1 P-loop containing nucleoside triphosphate hydrolase protein [Suillus paluster]